MSTPAGPHTSSTAPEAGIHTDDVHKTYRTVGQHTHALRGTTLTASPARLTLLEGRSGAGKTTLLNLLSGLDHPDSGHLSVAGHDLDHATTTELVALRRTTVATIHQNFALLELLTAEENIGIPLRITGTPASDRQATVGELLQRTGLANHAKQHPDELSGGQMQRVAIARALAQRPAVLLADEPTGQLDTQTGRTIMTLLRELVDTDGVTALVATHDPMLEDYADTILHLVDGQIITTDKRQRRLS